MKLAIVGGMGCGKSTVLNIFAKKGYTVINSDDVVTSLFDSQHPLYPGALLDAWLGTDFAHSASVEKSKLKELLKGPEDLKKLATILKPVIIEEIQRLHDSAINPVVEAPLLFEMGMADMFDTIICVTSSAQMERIKARNPDWTDKDIAAKLAAQLPIEYKIAHSDYTIYNERLEELEPQIDRIIQKPLAYR